MVVAGLVVEALGAWTGLMTKMLLVPVVPALTEEVGAAATERSAWGWRW